MEKSFFYFVNWSDAARLREDLTKLDVPYIPEQINGQLAFVFPDLHVRKYGAVRKLLGGDGERYRS